MQELSEVLCNEPSLTSLKLDRTGLAQGLRSVAIPDDRHPLNSPAFILNVIGRASITYSSL